MRTNARIRKAERAKARRKKPGVQLGLELKVRQHGGKRRGAGPKRRAARPQVPHRTRPALNARFPVLVTIRVLPHIASLRTPPCFGVVLRALRAAAERFDTRIVSYAVLGNHAHFVVESKNEKSLSRALIGLNTRIGRGINQVTGTRGKVIEDRPHQHALKTPSEVKNALRYVAENARRHAEKLGLRLRALADRFTSLGAIDLAHEPRLAACAAGPPTGASPTTWLLRVGWTRALRWNTSVVPITD